MSDGVPQEQYPGGGHATLADAVAVAIDWAASLPAGTVVTALGFGGGPSAEATALHSYLDQFRGDTTPPYWWSGGAVLNIRGGLSTPGREPSEEEQRRYNVRFVVTAAVVFTQAELKALAKRGREE